jgi:hypothetical protein
VLEVIVGVALTAVLGGLLVPSLKGSLDRRSEQFKSSVALVETLADSLWSYWKLALRVAYHGREGERGTKELAQALRQWDSDEAWQLGREIQIQVSRSKRLLRSPAAYQTLNRAQQNVVDYLDTQIRDLRDTGSPDQWNKLYESLKGEKRAGIDSLLLSATTSLGVGPYQRAGGAVDMRSDNSSTPDDWRLIFEDHVKGLEFEHELIDRKITWLLTSQTILFAALGLSLRAPVLEFVRIIATVGLVLCVFIIVGLVGNIMAKRFVYSDYRNRVDAGQTSWGVRGTGKVEFGVRSRTTWLGIVADIAIPLTFAVAWVFVLVLSDNIVAAAESTTQGS